MAFIGEISGISASQLPFWFDGFYRPGKEISACILYVGSCVEGGLCVHPAIAWICLVLIHPLLILWAWWSRK